MAHASAAWYAMRDNRLSARQRGYTWQWDKFRRQYLKEHPLCVMCQKLDGRVVPASVVDHIIPHKQNVDLMWDMNNLQPLCYHHHNSFKQSEERNTRPHTGLDGWPL